MNECRVEGLMIRPTEKCKWKLYHGTTVLLSTTYFKPSIEWCEYLRSVQELADTIFDEILPEAYDVSKDDS